MVIGALTVTFEKKEFLSQFTIEHLVGMRNFKIDELTLLYWRFSHLWALGLVANLSFATLFQASFSAPEDLIRRLISIAFLGVIFPFAIHACKADR